MNKRLLWGIVITSFFLFLSDVYATKKDEDVVAKIQERYQSILSFQGGFVQKNYSAVSTVSSREATGTVAYKLPGKMRWKYEKPNEQLLVTNGERVWLFDPLLENVTIRELKKVTQGSTLSFLLGMGNLKTDFIHRPVSKSLLEQTSLVMVELKPKATTANIDFIQLFVDPRSYDLKTIALMDSQGNYRVIEFTQLQYNVDLQDQQFQFEVTPEMEIIQAD